jgi:hypothetical protein
MAIRLTSCFCCLATATDCITDFALAETQFVKEEKKAENAHHAIRVGEILTEVSSKTACR